jgi:chromosome segregation ATPase
MNKLLALVGLTLMLGGCSSAYYRTMETIGVYKRDILVNRVEEAKDAQENGQEQFRSALEKYASVIEFDGGSLENQYDELNDEFEASEQAAADIRERISAIEEVAEDLFKEWETEIDQYTSQALKRDSKRKLVQTRRGYADLIDTMHTSEKRLEPALNAMRDQVLYLKHNLNAKAIAALKMESAAVKRDVDALLTAMQTSIDEAEAFLADI